VRTPPVATTSRAPVRRDRAAAILVVSLAVLALTTALALIGVGEPEREVFEVVNRMPGWLEPPIQVAMTFGLFIAVPTVALAAAALRRPRAGAAVAVAGTTAYLLARTMKVLVGRGRPLAILFEDEVVVYGTEQRGLGFPSGHAAVSAAIVCALIPYVLWRWRWWLLSLPVAVSFGRMYVGAHLPLDVLGGVALGAACAAAFHLAVAARIRPAARRAAAAPDPGG
jgi:undecaprenyl-diphosphatase